MKKILIVNGHQYHERSKGEYNRTLIKTAEDFLARNEFLLKKTVDAPSESFDDKNQFFEGRDVDGVLFNFHKAQQFLGLEQLPTFSCHNVIKAPDIKKDTSRFEAHLKNVLNTQ